LKKKAQGKFAEGKLLGGMERVISYVLKKRILLWGAFGGALTNIGKRKILPERKREGNPLLARSLNDLRKQEVKEKKQNESAWTVA